MEPRQRRKNRKLALVFAVVAVAMIGASFAAVPLYRLFCQVTGYAGTPRIQAQAQTADFGETRTITVRFSADVNRAMPWRFRPSQLQVTPRLGETILATYVAENLSGESMVGTATFNVTPLKAAPYFNKVECFCFTEQTLAPGERVEMPVSFFIDPEISEDPNTRDVTVITLSYTFFRAAKAGERGDS